MYHSQDQRKKVVFMPEIVSGEAEAKDFDLFRSSLVDLTPPSDLFDGDSANKQISPLIKEF